MEQGSKLLTRKNPSLPIVQARDRGEQLKKVNAPHQTPLRPSVNKLDRAVKAYQGKSTEIRKKYIKNYETMNSSRPSYRKETEETNR